MFRRLSATLPKDPRFSANLKDLGYFITETDQIKSIEHPTDDFQFFLTNNERYNNVQREAMHTCIRNEVTSRLASLNIIPLHLPQLSTIKPTSAPHLPILTTSPTALRTKKRVIVLVNRTAEDLAIWAYRLLSKSAGIDAGSAVSFVKEVVAHVANRGAGEDDVPGIVIMNPGQLLYSHKHERAMTPVAWDALPRKSATHPAARVHPVHNRVPGNATAAEHVAFVFENVIGSPDFVRQDAEVYVVGMGDGGDEVLKYFSKHWPPSHLPRIAALALTAPTTFQASTAPFDLSNPAFLRFLAARARAWDISHFPLGTPLANPAAVPAAPPSKTDGNLPSTSTPNTSFTYPPNANHNSSTDHIEEDINLFPRVAGGATEYAECVMPAAYSEILAWLEAVAQADAVSLTTATAAGHPTAKGEGYAPTTIAEGYAPIAIGEGYANEILEVPAEVVKWNEEQIYAVPDWSAGADETGETE